MRLGLEGKLPGLAEGADYDIGFGARSGGHRFVRRVGNTGKEVAKLVVDLVGLPVQRGYLFAHFAHGLLTLGSVDALLSQLADLGAGGVGLRFQLLGLRDGGSAAGIQLAELLDIELIASSREPRRDRVKIIAESG